MIIMAILDSGCKKNQGREPDTRARTTMGMQAAGGAKHGCGSCYQSKGALH